MRSRLSARLRPLYSSKMKSEQRCRTLLFLGYSLFKRAQHSTHICCISGILFHIMRTEHVGSSFWESIPTKALCRFPIGCITVIFTITKVIISGYTTKPVIIEINDTKCSAIYIQTTPCTEQRSFKLCNFILWYYS